ncbi:MAG: hypothetical protein NVV63_04450 [Opitutus sp.]|nr:hypothetical protein [Opitutus sp.]
MATSYFHPRYNDIPDVVRKSDLDPAVFAVDPDQLSEFTKQNLEPIYSDLITQLTIDLAAVIMPNLRAFSLPAFLKKHASDPQTTTALIDRQTGQNLDEKGLPGDRWLSPQSYPILSFIDRLERYNPGDSLLQALRERNKNFKHLISVSELTQSVIEGKLENCESRSARCDEMFMVRLPRPTHLRHSAASSVGRFANRHLRSALLLQSTAIAAGSVYLQRSADVL